MHFLGFVSVLKGKFYEGHWSMPRNKGLRLLVGLVLNGNVTKFDWLLGFHSELKNKCVRNYFYNHKFSLYPPQMMLSGLNTHDF